MQTVGTMPHLRAKINILMVSHRRFAVRPSLTCAELIVATNAINDSDEKSSLHFREEAREADSAGANRNATRITAIVTRQHPWSSLHV
jgi:hypothetical protein